MPSKLDHFYRSILFSKYFIKGWGDPEGLIKLLKFRKVVSNRTSCLELVDPLHPVIITKDETTNTARLIEGYFESPFNKYLPSLLPEESKNAFFQMVLPKKWKDDKFKPVCLHMAGTGDHFFWRRRKLMAQPLLKEAGIASIILENPFYGSRKPKYQLKSVLHNVSDIFVMGGCLILEALVLFYWCQQQGFGPLGVTGLSMGGHMASLAATNWPQPAILVPCLSWSTASGVFTKGVMSRSINWEMLASQYSQNDIFRQEIRKMLHSDLDLTEAFRAGQRFAHDFPKNMSTFFQNQNELKDVKYDLKADESNFYYKINSIFMEFLKSKFLSSEHSFTISNDDLIHNTTSGFSEFHDAVTFMRGIMDECTHLKNFSVPVDTSLIISVFAQDDGYVPRDDYDITSIWPGAEVRILNSGHIAAFVLYLGVFRKAIIDAFERYRQKY